ncbi:hypothetical protein CEXT_24141 [Caerostris extrusa]|uniref:C2H2-type domain-containing protein n=1 Tax=Caerostris extrusa TaxID=172846 RepID=A0AAV4RYC5_CAEEX|nr:hypothetical protein CEXT_24141 [Caerostris extrusa]
MGYHSILCHQLKKEKAKHQSGIHHISPSSTVVENSIGVSNNLNVNNFTEFTPPTTPDTPLVQPNHGTLSVEEQNITDSDYSQTALSDLSQILDKSSDELSVPLYGSLHHVWNVENESGIHAFAVVPDINNENVEKYICWKCVHFTCVDSNSIVVHYRQVHQVEGDIVAVYTLKEEEPAPCSSD